MRLIADLHTHTIASGHAYSTIQENAVAASKKGLEIIGITDHGPQMPGASHPYYFSNLTAVPEVLAGVRIMKGVEANIIDRQGNLDLDKRILGCLDLVAAGLHDPCSPEGTIAENTQAMIAAMATGWVDIIVHPGNPYFRVDPEQVVAGALFYEVVLELNNSSLAPGSYRQGSYDNCLQIASLAAAKGLTVVVGSDAHWAEQVGDFGEALALAEEAGIKPEQALNTSSEKVLQYLAKRHKIRQSLLQA